MTIINTTKLYSFGYKGNVEMILSEGIEKLYLSEILKLTGGEERLTGKPLLTEYQEQGFKNVLSSLTDMKAKNMGYSEKCDLFNRSLLILGIKPVKNSSIEVVFENTDFSDINQLYFCDLTSH